MRMNHFEFEIGLAEDKHKNGQIVNTLPLEQKLKDWQAESNVADIVLHYFSLHRSQHKAINYTQMQTNTGRTKDMSSSPDYI